MVGTLTVRENLTFSALLRLPTSCTWREQKDKVNAMINDLKLRKVADSRVKNLPFIYKHCVCVCTCVLYSVKF